MNNVGQETMNNAGKDPRNNQKGNGEGRRSRGRRGGRGRGGRGKPNPENAGADPLSEPATVDNGTALNAGEKTRAHGKGRRPRKAAGGDGNNGNRGRDPTKYPTHWSYDECLRLYAAKDANIVRGKLRVLPGKDGMAFCACDRGTQKRDVVLASSLERNRGLNGDTVFIELLPLEEQENDESLEVLQQEMLAHSIDDENQTEMEMWQDDPVQMELWNPVVPIRRFQSLQPEESANGECPTPQRKGRVVHVCAPTTPQDAPKGTKPRRVMVGTLNTLASGTCLFTPNDRTLPQFKCSNTVAQEQKRGNNTNPSDLYRADYIYHTWQESQTWPPCVNVQRLGEAHSIDDQINGILIGCMVDHGEFTPEVLKDVEEVVQSGVYLMEGGETAELGWKPTPDMYVGRRDYRKTRIFTIDPTTAKDLDDALHIRELPHGLIELGVHIADVSAFVTPDTDVDKEALRRATTVYLVDRTVPMLPRPLCEVACSLNENVERLAFSCVWTMKPDGSLGDSKNIWYGRTVIQSCARLDYATAQNIIDQKVAIGEDESAVEDGLWPKSRRPTGGHTIDEVAADVRLMHRVAMARRRLRFSNGALALHGLKLTFQLADDGATPIKVTPYPIKDSNRLVEEYMLLANYLVAQRLVTHAGDKAVLRRHGDPLWAGMDKVVYLAKTMFDFDIDASSSQSLTSSLERMSSVSSDDTFLQCMSQMLMTPFEAAEYFAAGAFKPESWKHYALNIPYYTHFTSPIRRYADILVHRLLQATIDGEDAVKKHPHDWRQLDYMCGHCNEKKAASKTAQERCDVVFLSLYLRRHPMKSVLGVVMSMGSNAFTVFVPSLGMNGMIFLAEHADWLNHALQGENENRRIVITRKPGSQGGPPNSWSSFHVQLFTRVLVSCHYKDMPRVDVKLLLEGPAP